MMLRGLHVQGQEQRGRSSDSSFTTCKSYGQQTKNVYEVLMTALSVTKLSVDRKYLRRLCVTHFLSPLRFEKNLVDFGGYFQCEQHARNNAKPCRALKLWRQLQDALGAEGIQAYLMRRGQLLWLQKMATPVWSTLGDLSCYRTCAEPQYCLDLTFIEKEQWQSAEQAPMHGVHDVEHSRQPVLL